MTETKICPCGTDTLAQGLLYERKCILDADENVGWYCYKSMCPNVSIHSHNDKHN